MQYRVIQVLPACTGSLTFRGRQQVRKPPVGRPSASTRRQEESDVQFHYLGCSTSSFQDYQCESHSDPTSDSDSRSSPPPPPAAAYRAAIRILRISTGFGITLLGPAHEAALCVLPQEGWTQPVLGWGRGASPALPSGTIALFSWAGSKIQQEKLIKSLLRGREKKASLYCQPHCPPPTKRQRRGILETGLYSECLTTSRLPRD